MVTITSDYTEQHLTFYKSILPKKKPLDRDEEEALFVRYQELSKNPVENKKEIKRLTTRVVEANLPLVISIARQYSFNDNLLELISIGNISLLKAVQKYKLGKGTRFTSYATTWIRGDILNNNRGQHSLLHLPRGKRTENIVFTIRSTIRAIEKEGREATPEVLATHYKVSREEMVDMLGWVNSNFTTSLDKKLGPHKFTGSDQLANKTIGETISDTTVNIEDTCLNKELKARFSMLVNQFEETLRPVEKDILRNRLLAETPDIMDVIAARNTGKWSGKTGLSRQRVQQIEKQLKIDLKEYILHSMN